MAATAATQPAFKAAITASLATVRARPNTVIHYQLFSPHAHTMPTVPLKPDAWYRHCKDYPEKEVIDAIIGIAKFGARIGFGGERKGQRIERNLETANDLPRILEEDIQEQTSYDRLTKYDSVESLPPCFYSSPLGLVDKPNGKKRRIHHLSYPAGESVNDGIPEAFGEISYATIGDVIAAIQCLGRGATMIKRDFADAFRQIPVSPLDTPLLGFHFQGSFYGERFLPFGLRTAPYLFNLFAEVFHWLLERSLHLEYPEARVVHYLDDFLVLLPPESAWEPAGALFQKLSEELGLQIKEAKNEQGRQVSFAGIVVDTEKMVIRLPPEKKIKGLGLITKHESAASISLFDLQQLTGFLNFVTIVVPLGRAFLRRLYNLQLFFPPGKHARRRISPEAQKDLTWWRELLSTNTEVERLFLPTSRNQVSMWTDAAGSQGIGGYFITGDPGAYCPRKLCLTQAFALAFPRHIQKKKEHINTKEMRAVEQGLLRWARLWKGTRVNLHIDNQAVVYGIANQSMRGNTMGVLRRCLLLASKWDIELSPTWLPTKQNALADALSRLDKDRIADLAPQLLPLLNHPNHGFQTSEVLV